MQLADFGARVIKIERKGVGDMARSWETDARWTKWLFCDVES